MEQEQTRRYFTLRDQAKIIEDQTGCTPSMIEAAVSAGWMNKITADHLKKGAIPVWSRVDFENKVAEVKPLFDFILLKIFWGELSSMTEEEMDKKIKESGLYNK